MTAVFAHTSFYAAIVNSRDELHTIARTAAAKITGRIVTTEFVLVETANFCNVESRRSTFLRLIANLRTSADVEIAPASSAQFEQGFQLFAARPDKTWSLTDCISIAVMRERGMQSVLTADRHFEQAGFTILLK